MEKVVKRGKYILTHERYIDDMGFERDSFDLFDSEKRTHFPFYGFIKANDKCIDFPINRIPYEYTEEDYEKMLDEQITKYELPTPKK